MSLQKDIKDQIKGAMLAKDTVRLEVLRGMTSAFTNELVAKGRKPQDELSDEEVIVVITRLAKQRRDSIEQFQKGGRADLVAEETAQLAIVETFLPTLMSREEIETFVRAKQAELSMTDKSKLGMFVGAVMKDLKGKADGGLVKQVVESLF